MNKRILVTIMVIAAGLMLGVILSNQTSKLKDKSSSEIPQAPSTIDLPTSNKENVIKASLKIDKTSIKAYDENVIDYKKEFEKVDKAAIAIHYENTSDKPLTNLKLWIYPTSPDKVDFSNTSTATTSATDISRTGKRVYDISDIKPKEAGDVYVWVFSKNTGTYNFSAQIKTDQDSNLSNRTNSTKLNVQ
ncbi:MAG TPA: hypothetical protein VLG67_02025 [Candidatus Saccharimonadales bacterium]|nr:hypothetical protein [Candidatus Saccharimonadales bacterium]